MWNTFFNPDRPPSNWLKLIAVFAMVIDHANKIICGGRFFAAEMVGRVAFPLFVYLLVFHWYYHTRSRARFVVRLALWALVSQLFFSLAFVTPTGSIFMTLTFGFILVALCLNRPLGRFLIFPIALSVAVIALRVGMPLFDFGVVGLLLICAFAWVARYRSLFGFIFLFTTLAFLNWSVMPMHTLLFAIATFTSLALIAWSRNWRRPWLIFLDRIPRSFWYAFYPAHLLVFVVAKILMAS